MGKNHGYVMVGAGFFLILINAIRYLTGNKEFSSIFIIGIVFVAVGMSRVRKDEK